MLRNCPDCMKTMSKRSFLGVVLDTCDHCAGIFFDEGEICQIKERGGIGAFDELDDLVQPEPGHVAAEEHNPRTCPGCQSAMRRFRYMYTSPVFLDSCDQCGGVWVEHGELHQMRQCLQAAKDGKESEVSIDHSQATRIQALNAIEKARGHRARIAASMIAYHKE